MRLIKKLTVKWCRFADEKLENPATYVAVVALVLICCAAFWCVTRMN